MAPQQPGKSPDIRTPQPQKPRKSLRFRQISACFQAWIATWISLGEILRIKYVLAKNPIRLVEGWSHPFILFGIDGIHIVQDVTEHHHDLGGSDALHFQHHAGLVWDELHGLVVDSFQRRAQVRDCFILHRRLGDEICIGDAF